MFPLLLAAALALSLSHRHHAALKPVPVVAPVVARPSVPTPTVKPTIKIADPARQELEQTPG